MSYKRLVITPSGRLRPHYQNRATYSHHQKGGTSFFFLFRGKTFTTIIADRKVQVILQTIFSWRNGASFFYLLYMYTASILLQTTWLRSFTDTITDFSRKFLHICKPYVPGSLLLICKSLHGSKAICWGQLHPLPP